MNHKAAEFHIRDIALDQIDRSRNHRIPMAGDAERIEALKASIEACGQLQPVRVYERGEDQKDEKHAEKYILGFGSRRCAAMELLGKKTIRAIVFAPASDAEIAQARAVENLHRQDITPLEEVLAVADVLEAIKADKKFKGDPYEEAATRLARSVIWVKDRDYLHRLTQPVQRFAMRSGLPAGHLRELAKVGDPVEQMRLACESVRAPAWCFAATDKDAKLADHAHQMQEGYFAELADGKVERWPLSKLKEEVGKVQLSLKVIPWEFDRTVEHGGAKLRKCAGCLHNSETDRTLFCIDEDGANPRGFCLNSSCYKAKQEAAQSVKEQVLAKISHRQVQTPEAIRKAAPEWIKESSLVSYVKRQLEKASNGQAESAKETKHAYAGRQLTEYELALKQFLGKFSRWQHNAWKDVLAAINDKAIHRVSWCVLLGVNEFWDHPRVHLPHIAEYSPECTEELVIPPLPKRIQQMIRLAFKASRNGWVRLLRRQKQVDPDQKQGAGIPHPLILQWLAEAVGAELPPPPEWTPPSQAAIQPTTEVEAVAA
ncbi:MAG TPA: ParB N-terminal domain-containing protein [Tepidisphaeraceae bacterium]|jgi:ParB/RepB/Spo0J family partition protein